jgi:RNA polymerase sigma factor (sigma-70 family)
MNMPTDEELLRQFAQRGAEEAFAELVRRHVGLVYGTALRRLCGNRELAEDVAQAVFTALAVNPGRALGKGQEHLAAWLYTTTRFMISHTVRAERRRQAREQKAYAMHTILMETEGEAPIQIPAEFVDDVLENLDDADRQAVLLRFFEGRSFAEIGTALHVAEDAARMRLNRALEKARALFERKGITSTTAALATVLASQSVAAPVGLAASVTSVALGSGAMLAGAAGSKTAWFFMTTSKATMGVAGVVTALTLGIAGYEWREARLRGIEAERLTVEREQMAAELQRSDARVKAAEQRATLAEMRSAGERQLSEKSPPTSTRTAASVTPQNDSAKDASERQKRLAAMKPLLAAGQPIKGTATVYAQGELKNLSVELVVGKETLIELDGGTYTVLPSLNDDGTISYTIALRRKGADGTLQPKKLSGRVTQVPWEGFMTGPSDGVSPMGFEPQ